MKDIKDGFYELVICVSLKNTDLESIEYITFDCRPSDGGDLFYETVIE
jgi:hypothetical protein